MENEEKETCLRYLPLAKDHFKMFTFLTNEQTGLLIKLIGEYFYGNKSFEDIEKNISNGDKIILPVIANVKENLDRATESYNKKCEQNRKNGKKGGAPKGNQNARKKKDVEPLEEPTPEENEEIEEYDETEETSPDIIFDIMYNVIDEISNYSCCTISDFFNKKQAIRFFSIFQMCDYHQCLGRSLSLEKVFKNGVYEFISNRQQYKTADEYLDDFEKDVINKYVETNIKYGFSAEWVKEQIEFYEQRATIAIEEIEEYQKQPKQPNG